MFMLLNTARQNTLFLPKIKHKKMRRCCRCLSCGNGVLCLDESFLSIGDFVGLFFRLDVSRNFVFGNLFTGFIHVYY